MYIRPKWPSHAETSSKHNSNLHHKKRNINTTTHPTTRNTKHKHVTRPSRKRTFYTSPPRPHALPIETRCCNHRAPTLSRARPTTSSMAPPVQQPGPFAHSSAPGTRTGLISNNVTRPSFSHPAPRFGRGGHWPPCVGTTVSFARSAIPSRRSVILCLL